MPQKDKNKGNKHAALPEGQRKRVQFSMSISGERLMHLVKYIQVTGDQGEVTDEQVAAAARQMLEEWIDKLEI